MMHAVVSGNKAAAGICHEHQVKPDLPSRWNVAFLDNIAKVFECESGIYPQ
jgi:hypothetical protein